MADIACEFLPAGREPLRVVDPACGRGALLVALERALSRQAPRPVELHGFETDANAADMAQRTLGELGRRVVLQRRDFLEVSSDDREAFDGVIANPPYVRTQVLGAERSQRLARQFHLKGRVDLSYAFVRAAAARLRQGGLLAWLTSNRFLSVQAGAAMRQLLHEEFELHAIYDLGDTRLFRAAVLPAIVVARKGQRQPRSACRFVRIYQQKDVSDEIVCRFRTPLEAVRRSQVSATVRTEQGAFRIERGALIAGGAGEVWRLSTPQTERWLSTVRHHQQQSFGDVARVRVGIKTTADQVFIRNDWLQQPVDHRPESPLLHPLITHRDAGRWTPSRSGYRMRVLYPYLLRPGRRTPIELDQYPRANCYLTNHRARLETRRYLIAAGRAWYEHWVPQQPADWAGPKLVFPDIAERPQFFLDTSGAIVNGDCYWITTRPGQRDDWLWLILAVANSDFVTRYYDLLFHNQLYAGRRRFMTQYVKQFPLPPLDTPLARQIVSRVRGLVAGQNVGETDELNSLVWQAFGLQRPAEHSASQGLSGR